MPLGAVISYDPLLRIDLGPLELTPHGLFTAVGVLVGVWAALPFLRRRGISDQQVYDIVFPCVVVALIGARLFYVVNHADEFDSVGEVFAIWEGGASLLGGLIPALLLAAVLLRRRHMPILSSLDGAAPGLAVGIAVGRIGDVLIADHLGKPTDFFLGYECPAGETGSPCVAGAGEAVHMTALYDLLLAGGIAALLVLLLRWDRRPGTVFVTFAALYAAARFVEGFARLDETHGTGLSGSQWTSLAVVAVAGGVAWAARRRPAPEPAVGTPGSSQPPRAGDCAHGPGAAEP